MSSIFKKTFLTLIITITPVSIFAIESQSYTDYKEKAMAGCENKPWTTPSEWGWNIVPIPEYPELTKEAIEAEYDKLLNEKNSPEEQERINKKLLELRSSNQNLFKTLELVRVRYWDSMNRVFGCAIIQSRENMIENLLLTIEKKFPAASQSEMKEKIKRETKKLQIQSEELNCTPSSGETSTAASKRVINSAIHQYCHYESYLKYLRDNLDKNNAAMFELDASIKRDENTKFVPIKNSDTWVSEISRRNEAISSELLRANQVLPKAIETFREMERTYTIHLMLVIIYDDYIRLRDNLNTYFKAVSQLLEKTQNAQIPNKN
jgi:hypothetical protein